jgi:cysteine-S-conjugate beta-lyase
VTGPLRRLTLPELRRRTSEKWRRYPADVLPAWVAEMDCTLAEPVVEAVTAAVRAGDTGYAHGPAYREAFAEFAARRWGWTPDVGRCRTVPDVMRGAVEVLGAVTGHGEGVVVNPPVYPPFYGFLAHAGRRVVEVPLDADGRLDLDVLAAAYAREDVTGHLLCSPHNPTGTVHTAEELRAVARLAERHGVAVVVDEIHAPLTAAGVRFVPYLSLEEARAGFAVHSASKAFNLAGVKAAVAVAGERSAEALRRLPPEVGHGVSHLGVQAHVAAFRHGHEWLDALLADLDENRRFAGRLFAERLPQARALIGEGTYLAWLDVRGTGLGDDPAGQFLERGRVALNDGAAFGTGGQGHVRVNLATTPEILDEVVARMATTVRLTTGR